MPDRPRRIVHPVRRRLRLVEEVIQPPVETRGFEEPWVYARRLVRGQSAVWILHTADCPLAPHRPISRWPVKCGEPGDRQAACGTLGPEKALRFYLDRGNEACAVCKPGILLRETRPGNDELNEMWALRGGM